MLWDWDDQNACQKTCVDSFGKMFSSQNLPIKLVEEFFWGFINCTIGQISLIQISLFTPTWMVTFEAYSAFEKKQMAASNKNSFPILVPLGNKENQPYLRLLIPSALQTTTLFNSELQQQICQVEKEHVRQPSFHTPHFNAKFITMQTYKCQSILPSCEKKKNSTSNLYPES